MIFPETFLLRIQKMVALHMWLQSLQNNSLHQLTENAGKTYWPVRRGTVEICFIMFLRNVILAWHQTSGSFPLHQERFKIYKIASLKLSPEWQIISGYMLSGPGDLPNLSLKIAPSSSESFMSMLKPRSSVLSKSWLPHKFETLDSTSHLKSLSKTRTALLLE